MPDTRVLSNQHRNVYLALDSANPIAQAPFNGLLKVSDFANFLDISSVVKWDNTDFAMQGSDSTDDRVLTDVANAQYRSYNQFSGGISIQLPSDTSDNSDLVTQTYNLLKTQRTNLWLIERVVYGSAVAPAANQTVNVYKVMTDGRASDVSGDTSAYYTTQLLSQGKIFPELVVAPATATALTETGHDATLTVGQYTWGKVAVAPGLYVTTRATWTSSAPAIATVDNRGLVKAVGAGTASITASLPGYTSVVIPITVTA